MLRLKSAIRLTREEGQIFETLTGLSTLPTSIAQYNRAAGGRREGVHGW